MKDKLTIIIAHYLPKNVDYVNPLLKTLNSIESQLASIVDLEIIIADDGSNYSKSIIENYSVKEEIKNDSRDFYILKNEKLNDFLEKNCIKSNCVNKWIYLPKLLKCMSKSRVLNQAIKISNSDNLLFLDDDNYFISLNTIDNLSILFKQYDFIVGQIKDNNGRFRAYSSKRVQGTTFAIKKKILTAVNGFGEWTEDFSCGVDSDIWIKIYDYFNKNKQLKACYTNQISTYDSHSKRWGKFTNFFKEWYLRKKFQSLYNCKNYKSARYNKSRNKSLWIKNLIDE